MARKEATGRSGAGTHPVWPRPQELKFSGKPLELTAPLRLATAGDADWLDNAAQSAADALNRACGPRGASAGRPRQDRTGGRTLVARGGVASREFVVASADALPAGAGVKPVRKPEGYALSVIDRGVLLAGADAAGIFHGAQTLTQLLRRDGTLSLPGVRARDWPAYRLRGCHLYLPGRKQFDFFRKLLDYLAALKYNLLVLETSGGVEYERHPEVSAAWRKFCRDLDRFEPTQHDVRRFFMAHPRGPCAVQNGRVHWKDSPHNELAGGDCLTKDELRWIAAECRMRHIEIVPEIQALSHSYWLCCAHPEIAERNDDSFPDTWCPSNPKSYELYFDCVEEVIEVLRPRMVSVGHDELYSIGICPRCRGKSGHDLLAGDLNRLHAWYAARGIRMMMWGDKLMNFTDKEGVRRGGMKQTFTDRWTGKSWGMPATFKAADRVPKDIVIADWYWGLDPKSERHFHQHGFEEIYGNFEPYTFENWDTRARRPYVLGAELSSWCEVSAYAFAHEDIFGHLFAASDMLWRGKQMGREELSPLMARRMPAVIDRMTGQPRWLTAGVLFDHAQGRPERSRMGGKGKVRPVDLQGAITPLSEFLAGKVRCGTRLTTATGTATFRVLTRPGGVLYKGIVLGKSNPKAPPVAVGRKARRLVVLHGTTMQHLFLQPVCYSYHRSPAKILKYVVKYADGRKAEFPAYYGEDIGQIADEWPRRAGVCFRAVPVMAGPGHRLYAQEWVNPRPKVAIATVTAEVGKDASEEGDILVAAMNTVE